MRLLDSLRIFWQNSEEIVPENDAKMRKAGLDSPLVHFPILPSVYLLAIQQDNHIVHSFLHSLQLPLLAETGAPVAAAHHMLLKRLEEPREVGKIGTDGPVHMHRHCDLQSESKSKLLFQQIMRGLRGRFEEEGVVVGVPIAECIHYIFKNIRKAINQRVCTAGKKDH